MFHLYFTEASNLEIKMKIGLLANSQKLYSRRGPWSKGCTCVLFLIVYNTAWHFTTLQAGAFGIQGKQTDSSHCKKRCLTKDAHSSRTRPPPGPEAVELFARIALLSSQKCFLPWVRDPVPINTSPAVPPKKCTIRSLPVRSLQSNYTISKIRNALWLLTVWNLAEISSLIPTSFRARIPCTWWPAEVRTSSKIRNCNGKNKMDFFY